MASVNKVILVGNLGKDVELRYTQAGDAIATLTVATSEQWKDKATGEKKEAVEWHRCSVFGKLAEICGQWLKKGAQVYLEGSLRTRKWTDKEGIERYTTEIRVDEMKMLGSKPAGGQRDDSSNYAPAPQRDSGGAPPNKRSFDDLGDDIPFQSTPRRGPISHVF